MNFSPSLYGSALWSSSDPALKPLETAFNNVLLVPRLPRTCHTGILHPVACVISACVISSYVQIQSLLIDVFSVSQGLSYTIVVDTMPCQVGCHHKKMYSCSSRQTLCHIHSRCMSRLGLFQNGILVFLQLVKLCTCVFAKTQIRLYTLKLLPYLSCHATVYLTTVHMHAAPIYSVVCITRFMLTISEMYFWTFLL